MNTQKLIESLALEHEELNSSWRLRRKHSRRIWRLETALNGLMWRAMWHAMRKAATRK